MTNYSNARSTSSYSNISISGSSHVMLGNYNVPDDTSQRQPMELLFRTFSTVLNLETTIRTQPYSPFYISKLQESLIERSLEFIAHLEAQLERKPSKSTSDAATTLIEQLEVLVAKLQDAGRERRPTSSRYENISITGGRVHAGNRAPATVPVYTYALRKALREYFRTQGRDEVSGEKRCESDGTEEVQGEEDVAGLPIRTAATHTTTAEARRGSVTNSQVNEDGWEDVLDEDF